eukprot:403337299
MSKLTVIEDAKGDTELNYFVFETHVRKLIRDLIDPFANKASEDREVVNETRRQLTHVAKRLHEIEYIIYKGNERNTIFDDIYNRVNQQNIEMNLMEEKIKEEVFKLVKRHDISEDRIQASESTQNTINQQIRGFQTDIDKFYEILHDTKKELGQTMYDNKQKADADFSSLNQQIIKIQTTLKINQHEFEGASSKIMQLEKERDKHQNKLEVLARDLYELREMKLDKLQFNMDTKKIDEQFTSLDYALGDLHNHIKGTDNYVEKYVPFKSLQLLIEGMSMILEKKQVKKLKEFEEKKYKEFHDTILNDDGNPRGDKIQIIQPNRSPTRKDTLTDILTRSPQTKKSKLEELLEKNPNLLTQNETSIKIYQQIQRQNEKIGDIVDEMRGGDSYSKSSQNQSREEGINGASSNYRKGITTFINANNQSPGIVAQRQHQSNTNQMQQILLSQQSPVDARNQPQSSNQLFLSYDKRSRDTRFGGFLGQNFEDDIIDIKSELENMRIIVKSVQGLDKDEIQRDFKMVRDEIKVACKEILSYCQAFQSEFESEVDLRKRQKINQTLEIEKLSDDLKKLNSFCYSNLSKPLNSLQDMTIVMMENSLIEQAVTMHTLYYQQQSLLQSDSMGFQNLHQQSDTNILNPQSMQSTGGVNQISKPELNNQIKEKQYDYEISLPGQHLMMKQGYMQNVPIQNFDIESGLNTPAQNNKINNDYTAIHQFNLNSARRQEMTKTSHQQHRKLLSSSVLSNNQKVQKTGGSQFPLRSETPTIMSSGAQMMKKRGFSRGNLTGFNSNQSSVSNLHITNNMFASTNMSQSNVNLLKNAADKNELEHPLVYRNKLFKRDQLTMNGNVSQTRKQNKTSLSRVKEINDQIETAGIQSYQQKMQGNNTNGLQQLTNHQQFSNSSNTATPIGTNKNSNYSNNGMMMAVFGVNSLNQQHKQANAQDMNLSPMQFPAYQHEHILNSQDQQKFVQIQEQTQQKLVLNQQSINNEYDQSQGINKQSIKQQDS